MKRVLMYVSVALALAQAGAATAQIPSPGMREYYEGTAIERKVADATALIVPPGTMQLNPGGTSYKLLTHGPFLNERSTGNPLCTDQAYRGLEHATLGRAGVLIGNRVMLTAPHFDTYEPGYAIFGLHRTSALAPYPDFDNIPAANVYAVHSIIHSTPIHGGTGDYMIFSLDPTKKPAPSAAPVPLRRSGTPSTYDVLTMIGHPEGLPTKIGDGGYLRGFSGTNVDIGAAPIWDGSSGTPVFNAKANVIETLIASGFIYANGALEPPGMPWRYDPVGACVRAAASSPHDAYYFTTNAGVAAFAPTIAPPATELQVSPQTEVTHVGAVGGSVTNPTSTFQVAAPSSATGPLSFTVAAPSIPGGPTITLSPPAGSYTVSTGSPISFTATASSTGVASCRADDASIVVTPTTGNGFPGLVRHRFEIGMTDFALTPSGGWHSQQLAPYQTRTLEVRNTRAGAQSVTVSSPAAWLLVDGGASATFALNPAGASGDRANFTISFNPAASGFPAHGTTGWKTITVSPNAPSCSVHGNEYYSVRLTPNNETFHAVDPGFGLAAPAPGQTFGTPTVYEWNLSGKQAFTVADLDLSLTLVYNGFAGVVGPTAVPTLKLVLQAPNGQNATIWDRQAAPSGYLDEISTGMVWKFNLDDQTTPPLGPNLFGSLNNLAGNGIWRLYAYSTSSTPVMLDYADLKVTRNP